MGSMSGARDIDTPSTSGYYHENDKNSRKISNSSSQNMQPGPSGLGQQESPVSIFKQRRRGQASRVTDCNEKSIRKEFKNNFYLFPKANRILMHKVNLLCLISYGIRINDFINDDYIKAVLLSLVPYSLLPTCPLTSLYLLELIEWYRSAFVLCDYKLHGILEYKNFKYFLQSRRISCIRDYVMLFGTLLRALGFHARFVMSFHPYPINVDDFDSDDDSSKVDNFTDIIISYKKGKGYVPSKKGKDLLSPEAVKRLNNGHHTYHTEEKNVENETVKSKKVKLDHWVEVLISKQWKPVNIIHKTIDNIDSIFENLTLPVKYCIAWENDNTIKEVTKYYAYDWFEGTNRRRADKLWIKETLDIFNKGSSKKHH